MALAPLRSGTSHAMRASLSMSALALRRPLATSAAPLLASRLALSRRPPHLNVAFRPLSTSRARFEQKQEFKRDTQFEDDPSTPPPEQPADTSLSGRLKHLIRAYGWYGVGVYTLLSTFDLSVAFGLIYVVGADHVREYTTKAKEYLWGPPDAEERAEEAAEAAKRKSGDAGGWWAMFALAYAVHKTLFLPFRVAGTAAITPILVRWLRARGWAGNAGTRRAVTEMQGKLRERRAAAAARKVGSTD